MMNIPESYVHWNRKVLEFGLSDLDTDGRFYINVREMLSNEPNEVEAEEQFRLAVASAYRILQSMFNDPIKLLVDSTDSENRPLCAAFLAVSVLAAEKMETLKYYEILANLLEQDISHHNLPVSFNKKSFALAWDSGLDSFLVKNGAYLQPAPVGGLKYVKLPKSHALLRACDLLNLPTFFTSYGYAATQWCNEGELSADFDQWLLSGQHTISKQGKITWTDTIKRPTIVKQLLRALERWDGSTSEYKRGGHVTAVQCYLHIEFDTASQARIFFRTIRRHGLPDTIDFAGKIFTAIDEDTYRDIPMTKQCNSGLYTGIQSILGDCKAYFRGGPIFSLVSSGSGMGYDQLPTNRLSLNESCAVLCHQTRVEAVIQHLRSISSGLILTIVLDEKLPDWRLLHGFKVVHNHVPPVGLDALGIEVRLFPRISGGLRISQTQSWLVIAPPTLIEAVGGECQEVTISGQQHQMPNSRALDIDGFFAKIGTYEIVIGERRVVKVIAPTVRNETINRLQVPQDQDGLAYRIGSSTDHDHAPHSRWLLGREAGQIVASGIRANFRAQWELTYHNGQRAAIALNDDIEPPVLCTRFGGRAKLWADVIVQFCGSKLGAEGQQLTREATRSAWMSYLAAGSKIVTQIRARERNMSDE